MTLLRRLFPFARRVPPLLRDSVERWRVQPAPDWQAPLTQARFVVVDTETTGLDPKSARLLSLGACTVQHGSVNLDQSFERTLRQETPSDDANILVHGLGHESQSGGDPTDEVLAVFLEFAGRPVFVGYHALFDAAVIGRALKATLGVALPGQWLDVAILLPALFPDRGRAARELDHWIGAFGLSSFARHGALSDAFVTAQLLLPVLARACARGIHDPQGLLALQREQLARTVTADGGLPAG